MINPYENEVYEKLKKLLEILKPEDRLKEVVDIEVDTNFSILNRKEKLVMQHSGLTKHIRVAGVGQTEDFSGISHLAYFNNSGKLVIKPKIIQELLDGI